MLTIFAIPKAFRGHIGVIQTNAIQSWVSLQPACEIILLGNDVGTAELASKLKLCHIPDIEFNEEGIPLVSSAFSIVQSIAENQLLCYVNADIILLSDFLPSVQCVCKCPFLLVGQRRDLDLNELVDFNDVQWEAKLQTQVVRYSRSHGRSGIDYFVFSRGLFKDIPLLAIGQLGWDNRMIYQARSLRIPIIDATQVISAIHQNHYRPHHRESILAGKDKVMCLEYATHTLTPEGVRIRLSPRSIYFRLRAIPMINRRIHFLVYTFKAFEKVVRITRNLVRGREE